MNTFDDQTTMARQARKHSGTGIYHKKMIKERSTLVALLAKNRPHWFENKLKNKHENDKEKDEQDQP